MRFRVIGAMIALATTAACGGGTSGGRAAQPAVSHEASVPTSPTVTMTIDDGSRLVHAVPWEVTATTGSSDSIRQVDFLVDGKTLWVEHEAPYVFDDDQQVLPPWLLGAGEHVLTARVRTVAGATGEATARVTVQVDRTAASRLVVGTYSRVVTVVDQRRTAPYRLQSKGAFGEVSATGRWLLHIKPDGEIVGVDPTGDETSPFVEPFTINGSTLTLYGPAVWRQPNPAVPSLFCEPETVTDYTWSVSGSSLTLTNNQEACADRDTVFVGTWTRRS